MANIYIPYSQAINYIETGDILLYRGTTHISFFLRFASDSPYTHVGFASKQDGYISCVEMREFVGGREVNLKGQVQKHSGRIDVFKPITPALIYDIRFEPEFKCNPLYIKYPGEKIVECARELTGENYGWDLIWWLSKRHLPLLRLFYRGGEINDFDDNLVKAGLRSYVCSTLVAHCIRSNWVDLVHMKPDYKMEPGDIANSALLQYAFTIYIDGDPVFEKPKNGVFHI